MKTFTLRLLSGLLGIVLLYGVFWVIDKLQLFINKWWYIPTCFTIIGGYIFLVAVIIYLSLENRKSFSM